MIDNGHVRERHVTELSGSRVAVEAIVRDRRMATANNDCSDGRGTGVVTESPSRRPITVTLRHARMSDVDALGALEQVSFESHRISRRSFRHFVASPKSTLLVAEVDGKVAGCALVLYRRGVELARLYSIATAAEFRRRGVALRLLTEAEQDATRRGCRAMRLEVREDDAPALALYEKSGYRRYARHPHYYDTRTDALRLQKSLNRSLDRT